MTGSPQPGQISCELNTCPPTALPHLARVPCCGEKDIRRTLCNDGRMTGEKTAPRGQGDGAVGESAAGVVLWSSAAWTWSGETGASAPVVSYAPSGIILAISSRASWRVETSSALMPRAFTELMVLAIVCWSGRVSHFFRTVQRHNLRTGGNERNRFCRSWTGAIVVWIL